jgi:hypothetical protein
MIHTESMLEKSLCLRSRFSTIASTTRSVFFTASFKSRDVCNRLNVSFTNVSASAGLSCEVNKFHWILSRQIREEWYYVTRNYVNNLYCINTVAFMMALDSTFKWAIAAPIYVLYNL